MEETNTVEFISELRSLLCDIVAYDKGNALTQGEVNLISKFIDTYEQTRTCDNCQYPACDCSTEKPEYKVFLNEKLVKN